MYIWILTDNEVLWKEYLSTFKCFDLICRIYNDHYKNFLKSNIQ